MPAPQRKPQQDEWEYLPPAQATSAQNDEWEYLPPAEPVVQAPTASPLERGISSFVKPTMEMWKHPIGTSTVGIPSASKSALFDPPPQTGAGMLDTLKRATSNWSLENAGSNVLDEIKSMNPIAMDRYKSGDKAGAVGESAANLLYLLSGMKPGAAEHASVARVPSMSSVPEGIKAGAKGAAERLGPLGKVAAEDLFSRVPVAGRVVRRPSYGDYWKAGKSAFEKKPTFPSEVQGPRMETGQFDLPRFEGEYVDPAPIPRGRDIPFAPSEIVFPKALPESASVPRDMPYGRGPGEVPGDIVGTPNDRVLAGGAGIRTTARGLLPEPAKLFEGPPPPQKGPHGISERRQDMAIMDAMREDMAQQERAGLAAESRQFADRNSMDSPKWLRNQEAKNELAMLEAERKAKAPVKYTKTVTPKAKKARLSVVDQVKAPDDLESVLAESIRRARAARKR